MAKCLRVILTVVTACLMTTPAAAQATKFFGANAGISYFQLDKADSSRTGGSFGLELGYHFSETVALRGSYDLSPSNKREVSVVGLELGPRFMLVRTGKVRPFLDVAASYSFYDMGFLRFAGRGFGATGALGVQYQLSDWLAVDLRGAARRTNFADTRFAENKVEGYDDYGWQTLGRFGVTIYFW